MYAEALDHMMAPQPFTFTPEHAAETLRRGATVRGGNGLLIPKMRPDPTYTLLSRVSTGLTAVLGGLHATGYWKAIREEYWLGAPPATEYGELEAAFRMARP
jgi:hypothetical protein